MRLPEQPCETAPALPQSKDAFHSQREDDLINKDLFHG
jgi:hypothetical protein